MARKFASLVRYYDDDHDDSNDDENDDGDNHQVIELGKEVGQLGESLLLLQAEQRLFTFLSDTQPISCQESTTWSKQLNF